MHELVVVVAALAAVPGCFNSLVDGACADGYAWQDGACRLDGTGPDADPDPLAPDADPGPRPDGDPTVFQDAMISGPDAMVCLPTEAVCGGTCIEVETNPNACGDCGIVCPTGICVDSACVGGVIGRTVLIGHDYRGTNVSATRLLGNAMDLPPGEVVRVGVWRGTANNPHWNAANTALTAGAAAVALEWDRIELETLPLETAAQVIVILPQDGSAADALAAGQAWATAAAQFISAGGVVIALGGNNTKSEQVLIGAGLLDATYTGNATGDDLVITAPVDALAAGVATPYRAEQSTSAYAAGRGTVVVESEAGDAVVIDAAGL